MTVVPRLLANDPEWVSVTISFSEENDDLALAGALDQNPHYSALRIMLRTDDSKVKARNFETTMHVIATRSNLESATLEGDANEPIQTDAAVAFLHAFQQNKSIKRFELIHLILGGDLCVFVDTAQSVCSLKMEGVLIKSEVTRYRLAEVFQRNKNIQQLDVGLETAALFAGNASVKTLRMYWEAGHSQCTYQTVQQVLQASAIERFELIEMADRSENGFRAIAQGIINSKSILNVQFTECYFHDEESVNIFDSILRAKRNLSGLGIEDCHTDSAPGKLFPRIVSFLVPPGTPLRSLNIEYSLVLLPIAAFKKLMAAVAKSKLDRFSIGMIVYVQHLKVITDSIPDCQLSAIEVRTGHNADSGFEQEILQALKRNCSLQSVTFGNLFDANDADRTRLAFYMNRNKRYAQWLEDPKTLPRHLWPDALKLASSSKSAGLLYRAVRKRLPYMIAEQDGQTSNQEQKPSSKRRRIKK